MPKRTDISSTSIVAGTLALAACAQKQSDAEIARACLTDVTTLQAANEVARGRPGQLVDAGRCSISIGADGQVRAVYIEKHPQEPR